MHDSHPIKAYSRTQSNVALSSGEAGFYVVVSAASESCPNKNSVLVVSAQSMMMRADLWLLKSTGEVNSF